MLFALDLSQHLDNLVGSEPMLFCQSQRGINMGMVETAGRIGPERQVHPLETLTKICGLTLKRKFPFSVLFQSVSYGRQVALEDLGRCPVAKAFAGR